MIFFAVVDNDLAFSYILHHFRHPFNIVMSLFF